MRNMKEERTLQTFGKTALFALALGMLDAPVKAAVVYSVTDLGTIGGTISSGSGINATGQVAGYAFITGDTANHAVRWTGATATDLGTLGGTGSLGVGINVSGQVAGYSATATSGTHAVRWTGTTAEAENHSAIAATCDSAMTVIETG